MFIQIRVGAPFSYTFAGQTISGSSNAIHHFARLAEGEHEIVGQADGGVGVGFFGSNGWGITSLQVLEGSTSARDCDSVSFGEVGNPGSAAQSFRLRVRFGDIDTPGCLN